MCLEITEAFEFDEGAEWARLAVDSTREISTLKSCLSEVSEWLEAESQSREGTE